MRPWTLFAVLGLALSVGCESCESCRSEHEPVNETRADAFTAETTSADGGVANRAVDGSIEGDSGGVREAGPPRPPQSPLTVAQRFVVGWASGNLESLEEMSDGEAAELVRRARDGESVDTPLGTYAPDGPRPVSFSFADRRASQPDQDTHRIEFSLTITGSAGGTTSSRHVVIVRRTDSKVINWNAPSPLSDGGV